MRIPAVDALRVRGPESNPATNYLKAKLNSKIRGTKVKKSEHNNGG